MGIMFFVLLFQGVEGEQVFLYRRRKKFFPERIANAVRSIRLGGILLAEVQKIILVWRNIRDEVLSSPPVFLPVNGDTVLRPIGRLMKKYQSKSLVGLVFLSALIWATNRKMRKIVVKKARVYDIMERSLARDLMMHA